LAIGEAERGPQESERPALMAKPLSSGFDGVATQPIESERKTNMTSKAIFTFNAA
jgi:hypothetical protein